MIPKRSVQIIFYNDPDNYPPIVNGVRLLAEAGWQIELVCRGGSTNWNVKYPDGVAVTRINPRGRTSWKEYLNFIARLLWQGSREAALIYAHDMYALPPARILATMHRLPLAFHSHDYAVTAEDLSVGARTVHAFQRRFASTADLMVVPDADRARVIARELRLKSEPMVVANAPLMRPKTRGRALREALAERGFHFTRVVFRQGRIGAGHGIELTLRSVPLWASENWGFVVMGTGEPSYVEKLKRDASALGVEKQFVVLPPVGYDLVADFTLGAHVGHALYEPIHFNNVHIATASNKIMEYMEAGLPLLMSDTPALKKIVNRFRCGVIADESSPWSIAAGVNTLLSDLEHCRSMGASARRAFEEVFCYNRQFAKVLSAFDKLSSNSNGPGHSSLIDLQP